MLQLNFTTSFFLFKREDFLNDFPDLLVQIIRNSEVEAFLNGKNNGKLFPNVEKSVLGFNTYIEGYTTMDAISQEKFKHSVSDIRKLIPSDRSIVDGGIILTKTDFYAREDKNSKFNELLRGARNGLANDLMRDAYMLVDIEFATAFKYRYTTRNIALKNLRNVHLTATTPSSNGPADLSTIMNTIAKNNRFSEFRTTNSLSFPAFETHLYLCAEQLNVYLSGRSLSKSTSKGAAMIELQSYINSGEFLTKAKSLSQIAYSENHLIELSDQYFESIKNFFLDNLADLVDWGVSGSRAVVNLKNRVNILFKKTETVNINGKDQEIPVKVKVSNLPENIKLFEISIYGNGRWVDLRSKYSGDEWKTAELDSAYIIVHDKQTKVNGLMKVENVKNKILGGRNGIVEGFYDKGYKLVHNNIFVSDAHGNYLYSRVDFSASLTKDMIVRPENWYTSFTSTNGKLQKEFYIVFGLTSGNQYLCFLFDADVTLNPKDNFEEYLHGISLQRSKKDAKIEIKNVQLKTHISEETAKSISSLIPMVFELFNSLPSSFRLPKQGEIAHRDIVITDSLTTLHNPITDIAHITKVVKFLEPRSTEDLYDAIDPSSFLKGITHFKKLDQTMIAKNKIDSFIFRNTLLKLIKNVLDREPSDESYQYFEKVLGSQLFNYFKGKVFAGEYFNDQDFLVDASAGIDETPLIKTLDRAIEKLFGYTTTLFLKTGLVSFSRVRLGVVFNNYEIEFVAHNSRDLFDFAKQFQIRSLCSGETKTLLSESTYINEYENRFLSMLLSGNQERVDTVDLNGKPNQDFLFQKSTPINSPFLQGLFDNIEEGSFKTFYHRKISNEFINWFYKHFDSDRKVHKLFIEGREVLQTRISEMLEDQISLYKIKLYFYEEIETMVIYAPHLTFEECAKIKHLQIIQYMTKIYTEAVYFPRAPQSKSDILAGKTNIGDISKIFMTLLKNPLRDTALIPFPTSASNQFFQEFSGLTFSLKKFSAEDINLILPTLGYKYSTLPSQLNRFTGDYSNLYDLMAIMPELSEQIQKLFSNFKSYFADYISATSIKDFAVKFYLPKALGIVKVDSLLRKSVSASFRKDSSKLLIDELKGEFLEFTINTDDDLEKMVANIVYYMLKYNCIAAVNEGKAVKNDVEPNTKYSLIASPGRLYSTDFLLSSQNRDITLNIKNNGLSSKAVELYQSLFGINQDDLYSISRKSNSYSKIWSKSFIYSPYIMSNSHLFKQYFVNFFKGRSDIIEDLRDSGSYTN